MMKANSEEIARATAEIEEAAHAKLVPQLRMMTKALFASPLRGRLLTLAAGIFVVIVLTAYGQIRLNSWNEPFYDALARRDLTGFITQLGMFCLIAGGLLVLNVAQRWLGEMTKLKLREGLVRDLVGEWLGPRRAFRLANAGPIGVNPDQRMHEDARHLSELSTDLGVGLLQASILLVTFVSVLWALSSGFTFHFEGREITIPGYMVWAAFVYAGSASLLSYWVGRRLIAQNSERYSREADLRFGLMRVNEHIDAISLSGGEADEARRIGVDLDRTLLAMRRIVGGLTNLTWVTAGYGWFTIIAPILVAAPVYFAGNLSFGGLMMAVGAFNQVQSSLRWFVDNFSSIADWRATLLRVASFRRAVLTTDVLHDVETRIEFVEAPPGTFIIDHLEIASPSGCTMLRERDVVLKTGERVLIVGQPGTGKTLLFRALAGLWPWGSGRIGRPAGEKVFYMPRSPYLPPGSVREVLAYPAGVEAFDTSAYEAALARVGLERLKPDLDTRKRWERLLSTDEQQALAFARLLLHKPDWILIDEVLDAVDEDTRQHAVDILLNDLPRSGIIYIGRERSRDQLYSRTLHLIKDPATRTLVRVKAAAALATPAAAALARDVEPTS